MPQKTICLNSKHEKLLSFLPFLWIFFIPLGNTPRAIGIIATLISICFQKNIRKRMIILIKTPWFYLLITAILWTYLSCLWAPSPNPERWFYLNKISFFWILPFLMLGFARQQFKAQAYQVFLISMLIPLSLSFLKFYFHLPLHHDITDPGLIFYNHIITGFYASFAAFLSIELFLKEKKYYYLIGFLLFSFQVLYINPGKTAYGILILLTTFSIWNRTNWKIKTLCFILAIFFGLVLIKISPGMQLTLHNLSHDIEQFKAGNLDTSFGYRVQFHQFAYQLFKNHWLIGNGIGGYDYWFKLLNPVPAWPYQPNSHSQYWFFACDLGIIGLALWIGFFISLVKKAQEYGWQGHIFIGFMIAFGLNCFTDNMLFASPLNLLFILWGIAYPTKN